MARKEFLTRVCAAAFSRANGACEKCGARLSAGKFHYDHIIPDAMGGKPTLENCQVLCRACHDEKTHKADVPQIARAKRREARHIGAKAPSKRPMPGGRGGPWKRTFRSGWVKRDEV